MKSHDLTYRRILYKFNINISKFKSIINQILIILILSINYFLIQLLINTIVYFIINNILILNNEKIIK